MERLRPEPGRPNPRRDGMAREQSEHPVVSGQKFASVERYCLALMHEKSYVAVAEHAAGRSVLDFGCNDGYGTRLLAKHAARVVGVDVSPVAIAAARAGDPIGDLRFELLEGPHTPFEDGEFDLVVSFQVIEHVRDHDAYLAEIRRVLRPGGLAVLTTPNALQRLEPGQPPWSPFHVREYSPKELAQTLQTHFDRVEVRGLFGSAEITRIETARIANIRASLRPPRSRLPVWARELRRGLRSRLPAWSLELVRRARGREVTKGSAPGAREVAEFAARVTLDDLWYDEARVDDALDLIAYCR